MRGNLGFALGLAWCTASMAVPRPTNDTFYSGAMKMSNEAAAPISWRRDLSSDSQEACRVIHRSLYLIENQMARLKNEFKYGQNFKVLFANEGFYRKALRRRFAACTKSGVSFYKHGRCGTQQETVAFVNVTLGFVHSTINLCDEFFASSSAQRRDVVVHEFGRLEDIGDDPGANTNNIFIWDALNSRMGDSKSFEDLVKP